MCIESAGNATDVYPNILRAKPPTNVCFVGEMQREVNLSECRGCHDLRTPIQHQAQLIGLVSKSSLSHGFLIIAKGSRGGDSPSGLKSVMTLNGAATMVTISGARPYDADLCHGSSLS